MNYTVHNKLVSFIWSIADDCLRDVYVRGKYRDVILPMVVLRRLDSLLEPSKDKVLAEVKFQHEEMEATELEDLPLTQASGYVFYNISKWTLRKLFDTATNNQQILLANVEDYLNGFSPNVKEIVDKFKLKSQVRHMASKDVLLDVLEKFTSDNINLTPVEGEDPDGNKLPALTNLGMGYVFEELIRKFNEDNNEEAGEHFTPREVIELMTHLVFDPIKDQLPPVITIYDPACGSGGMLTESQNFIKDPQGLIKANSDIYLYGKEINDETYAICKSDMMIKDNNPENIKIGSTLSTDEFAGTRFDFMLSNPPYGKSWASEQKNIKDGSAVIDSRFRVKLKDYWGVEETVDAAPRSSDGQLLFLMEMVSKMKEVDGTNQGSRIASVHNGSSLFTGDAGGGESNIRRYIIENDLLDAIIQLPNNLFYNTGITTYIWLLSNKKPEQRKNKVQLIDASQLFRKLRKNLGNKNCEFSPEHIQQILDCYLTLSNADREADAAAIAAKVFDNSDFGYYKVNIERPDRRKAQFTAERIAPLRFDKTLREPMKWAYQEYGESIYQAATLKAAEKPLLKWCEDNQLDLNTKSRKKLLDISLWLKHRSQVDLGTELMELVGDNEYDDYNQFKKDVDKQAKAIAKDQDIKIAPADKTAVLNAVSWYDQNAEKVIARTVKLNSDKLALLIERLDCTVAELPDHGYYPLNKGMSKAKSAAKGDQTHEFIIYESNSDLRDSESIPLKQVIYQYFLDEVKPHVPEAWVNLESVKIGYEVSFNKHFYRHKALRAIGDVAKDIMALEQQAEGLISEILGLGAVEQTGVNHD